MTTATPLASRASAPTGRPPLRILLITLHLGALGVVGLTVCAAVLTAIGTGIGLIVVAGLGFVILIGVVYALFGIA